MICTDCKWLFKDLEGSKVLQPALCLSTSHIRTATMSRNWTVGLPYMYSSHDSSSTLTDGEVFVQLLLHLKGQEDWKAADADPYLGC